MKTYSIRALYPINMAEGEGIGTAYEYYVKLGRLRSLLRSVGKPKSILVAGLPEKYGLSMDFILLGWMLHAEVTVVDDRAEFIERAERTVCALGEEGLLSGVKVNFKRVARIAELGAVELGPDRFDFAVSNEVFQRLNKLEKGRYISGLRENARSFALFVPNGENRAHADLSGLSGERLER